MRYSCRVRSQKPVKVVCLFVQRWIRGRNASDGAALSDFEEIAR